LSHLPQRKTTSKHIRVLTAQSGSLTVFPEPNSVLEQSLLVCSIFIFLDGEGADVRYRAELRRLLGAVNYQHLVLFAAYVKTCHVWLEANPEISYEADKRVIDHLGALVEEPGLADFFRNYGERVRYERQSRTEQLAELAECKLNKDALRESEDQYRRLVELSPDTVFVQSEGKFVFINSAGAKLLGAANPKELTGKPVLDCIPEDRESVKERIQHLLEGNVVPLVEEKFIRMDGTVVDVEVAATSFSYGGKPAVQVVARDITQRKQAESALRSSLATNRALLNAVPDLMFRISKDGTFVNFKAAKDNNLLVPSSEFLGKNLMEVLPHEVAVPTMDCVERALSTGDLQIFEYQLLVNNNLLDYEARIVVSAENEVMAIVRDVTERKRAEERSLFLAEASSVLGASIDYKTTLASIARLVVPTLADFCFFDVLTADKKIQRVAWQHAEPAKQEWFDQVQRYVPPADFPNHYVTNVLSTGKAIFVPQVNDAWMQTVATSAADLQFMRDLQFRSLMTVPLIAHERKLGTLTFCLVTTSGRNYTSADLTLAEDLAHRAALALDNARLYGEAQQALQEKEVLLKEIHHRVKNNLQIVSGLLYLQFRYIEDEQTLQVLQQTRTRIQSMALVHEKLYGSKNLDKIDFKDYIYSLLQNLFMSYCVNRDLINLIINIEPFSLNIDTAIPSGLIINELVSNALKHAFPLGQSGEIAVEFYATDSNSFELIVRDNGVGFTEKLDFQNQKSLGLRLVHSLVTKQLEGTIELEKGQGAKFKLCLKA